MNGVIIAAIICGTVIILSLIENRKSSYKRKYEELKESYNQYFNACLPDIAVSYGKIGDIRFSFDVNNVVFTKGSKTVIKNTDEMKKHFYQLENMICDIESLFK